MESLLFVAIMLFGICVMVLIFIFLTLNALLEQVSRIANAAVERNELNRAIMRRHDKACQAISEL